MESTQNPNAVEARGENPMILSTLESIPGQKIVSHFGWVTGNSVRTKHLGRDLMAGLKNIVGGELSGYTELLQESRQEATHRMVSRARELGANAVIGIRIGTSAIAQNAAEVVVYGTAVWLE